MQKLHQYLFAIITATLIVELLLLLAPAPSYITDVQLFRLQLTLVTSFSVYYFAAAVVFLYGIHDFKTEMRRSYHIITMSMAFFGFVNLQYPILLYAGLVPGPWLAYGGSLLVIVPGVIMHYWGVRHVAKTLGLAHKSTSVGLLVATILAVYAVVIVLPHVQDIPAGWYMLHQAAAVVNLLFNLFSFFILVVIVRAAGASYKPAFRWLNVSVSISALGFLHILITALFGQNSDYATSGSTAVPFVLVSVAYVVAGYYFCKIRFYGQHSVEDAATSDQGILDAVVSTANLISNTRDVDILLDGVRQLTAKHTENQPMTTAETEELVRIYLALEDYLLHREKLKNFTQQDVRARLNSEARHIIEGKA